MWASGTQWGVFVSGWSKGVIFSAIVKVVLFNTRTELKWCEFRRFEFNAKGLMEYGQIKASIKLQGDKWLGENY